MSKESTDHRNTKAYNNERFINSRDGRALRILAEYLEPESRFERYGVSDTIVFMGSARIPSREQAEQRLHETKQNDGDLRHAEAELEMSKYYEAARELARRLTEWSKQLGEDKRRFVVCSGGGPGIMEAANRGASEAKGMNVGLTISLPKEEFDNAYTTRGLSVHFHYFFMRKFWFMYLSKAVIVFPGGFGTLDELFETLTLLQTHKIRKHLPVVLFGRDYWNDVINFDALIRAGTINAEDINIMFQTDSVDEAYDYVTSQLIKHGIEEEGAIL